MRKYPASACLPKRSGLRMSEHLTGRRADLLGGRLIAAGLAFHRSTRLREVGLPRVYYPRAISGNTLWKLNLHCNAKLIPIRPFNGPVIIFPSSPVTIGVVCTIDSRALSSTSAIGGFPLRSATRFFVSKSARAPRIASRIESSHGIFETIERRCLALQSL